MIEYIECTLAVAAEVWRGLGFKDIHARWIFSLGVQAGSGDLQTFQRPHMWIATPTRLARGSVVSFRGCQESWLLLLQGRPGLQE